MDELFGDMIVSLREGQKAIDQELRPLLETQPPDWSMLMRLRDVADEYAGRARLLRQMMTDSDADDIALKEVDQLCKYFDGTADLIAQETGDAKRPQGDRGTVEPTRAEEGRTMTTEEHPDLEYLRIEVHRLGTQLQSLRSAMVVSSNCIADLMLLLDDNRPEQRDRARNRVVDALSEIDRHLSGPSFGNVGPDGDADP